MRSSQTTYLAPLDHLRFLAAILVVMYHYIHTYVVDIQPNNPLLSLVEEGHTGIGLFMVISGFIFTVITNGHQINYWGFLRNRLIRIYPLYLFAVFLSLFISTYNEQRNYGLLEFLGWLLPFRASTVPDAHYFVQLWTIWVEFQFYLIFPFLKLFHERYGTRYLWSLIGLLIGIRMMVFISADSVRFIAHETIFGRLDEFLVGMLAGIAWNRNPRICQSPLHLLASGVLVLGLLQWFNLHGGSANIQASYWIIWTTAEGTMWAWLLLAYLAQAQSINKKLSAALAWGGSISFSIYVMHNLVLATMRKFVSSTLWSNDIILSSVLSGALIMLPAIVVVAAVTYRLIELPFLDFRSSYLRSRRQPPA